MSQTGLRGARVCVFSHTMRHEDGSDSQQIDHRSSLSKIQTCRQGAILGRLSVILETLMLGVGHFPGSRIRGDPVHQKVSPT